MPALRMITTDATDAGDANSKLAVSVDFDEFPADDCVSLIPEVRDCFDLNSMLALMRMLVLLFYVLTLGAKRACGLSAAFV
eukprot:1266891-Pleurochrysis_carterae.AAC.1